MVTHFPTVLLQAYKTEARRSGISFEELLVRKFDNPGRSLCIESFVIDYSESNVTRMCSGLNCSNCFAHSSNKEKIKEAIREDTLEIKLYSPKMFGEVSDAL